MTARAGHMRKRMIWSGFALAVIALGWGAFQYAVSRNGPAVVDAIDRITGGMRDVSLAESASFGGTPAQTLAVYRPSERAASAEALPVILFIHGGSWKTGDPDDYGFVARALVPEGFVVVLAGYRLHPGARFPAMVEDAASALAWTHANIARHGGDPRRIVLAGHSAGAYNAVMAALDPRWLADAKLADTSVIRGVVGLAGPYDFYPFDKKSTKDSFGSAPRPQLTQPVNFARAEAPAMLLMTGERDDTVKPRNTRALAAALEQAGARVETRYFPEMDHSDILLALASPWRRNRAVIDPIVTFARDPATADTASVPVQGEMR